MHCRLLVPAPKGRHRCAQLRRKADARVSRSLPRPLGGAEAAIRWVSKGRSISRGAHGWPQGADRYPDGPMGVLGPMCVPRRPEDGRPEGRREKARCPPCGWPRRERSVAVSAPARLDVRAPVGPLFWLPRFGPSRFTRWVSRFAPSRVLPSPVGVPAGLRLLWVSRSASVSCGCPGSARPVSRRSAPPVSPGSAFRSAAARPPRSVPGIPIDPCGQPPSEPDPVGVPVSLYR